MSIHRKLASFVVMEASWISWLLAGFSMGGIGVVLDRAITLLRGSELLRRFRAPTQRPPCRDPQAALLLSSSWS
jgi:hypothetical protein